MIRLIRGLEVDLRRICEGCKRRGLNIECKERDRLQGDVHIEKPTGNVFVTVWYLPFSKSCAR